MKKQINLKSIYHAALVALCLMTAGVGEMWGDECPYHVTGGYIYLDATAPNWTESYIYLGHGHDTSFPITRFSENKISGTNLYWINNSVSSSWASNVCYLMFFAAGSAWPSAKNYEDVKKYAPHYSGKSTYSFDKNSTYLVILGASNDDMATISNPSGYNGLNHAQTVKKYTWNETSFTERSVNSGTVTISAYKMTANGTASKEGNSATLDEASETSDVVDAAYTGEVTLTAEANEGYVFMGWFASENGYTASDTLSTAAEYTYNAPNSTKTIYARFAPKFTPGSKLYLKTDWKDNDSKSWEDGSAEFYAVFGNATRKEWVACSSVVDHIHSVTVPEGNWGDVIFCRMNPERTALDFTNTNRWNQTDGLGMKRNENETYNCIVINGWNSGAWTKYAPSPALSGLELNNWSSVAHPFDKDGKLSIALNAHSGYKLKVTDGTTWYGLDNTVILGKDATYTLVAAQAEIKLNTADITGTYTFTWNAKDHQLTIEYPDVPHPNLGYVYFEDINASPWSSVKGHVWGGTYVTTWSSDRPLLGSFTMKEKTYYYAAIGNNNSIVFCDGSNNDNKTSDLKPSLGQYYQYNHTSGEWKNFEVTIALNNQGADKGHEGTSKWDVALNDTSLFKATITCPEKTNYEFAGYYTEPGGAGEQIILATGKWKKSVAGYTTADTAWIHGGDTTKLYAKWTETRRTITLAVSPTAAVNRVVGGTTKVNGVTGTTAYAYIESASQTITADSSNCAYRFKKWDFDDTKITIVTGSATSKSITITSNADATLTAVFEPRYGLVGSLTNDMYGGMHGWVWSDADDFVVEGFTNVGQGTDMVNLRCSLQLNPNADYKFRIYDRVRNNTLGCAKADYLPAQDGDGKYKNWQLNHITMGGDAQDVLLRTVGRGTYIFHITNISDDSNYWPSIQVERQPSYQLNLNWGHAEVENPSSFTDGGTGGTVTATATENGSTVAITNGQWIAKGGTLTFTPSPADDYTYTGCASSSSADPFMTSPAVINSVKETANVYVKFTEKSKTFSASSDNNWSTPGNWSGGAVPTANEVAILQAPVNVDIAHAVAKRVIIDQNDHTGKLTIQANKGLELTGTIRKTTDGSSYGAPTAADLVLESSSEGNASLIFDNSNFAQATVQMYSKAYIQKSPEQWNWQFMGIPFTTTKANPSYYGSYLYEWQDSGTWAEVANGGTMTAFTGYCITQDAATTYVMSGTLNPTTSHKWTIPAGKEFVMANSWSAPIYVGAITDEALAVKTKTIYFFNTGHNETGATAGTEAGTYVAVPIHSAPYTGDSLIAPMQGFYVNNTGGSEGTVTLNYATVVRPAATRNDIVAGSMYAPKRGKVEEAQPDNRPTVLKLWANGAVYNDRVVVLEREDFSYDFDNGWDGKKLSFGEVGPSVYVINSLGEPEAVSAIPNLEGTVIGFRAGTNNTCTMTFEYDGEDIFYLNDLQTEQSTRIDNERSYTFATDANDDEARFVISATPIAKTPTGIDPVIDNRSPLTVTKILLNGHIYIIREGRMFGIDGLLVK